MDTLKKLYSNTLGNAEGTLYTVPANTKTIYRHLTVCNKSAADTTFTLKAGGVYQFYQTSIAVGQTITVDLYQVLEAGATITGLAGAAAAVDAYLSGIEVA